MSKFDTFEFETLTITGIKEALLGLGQPKIITRSRRGRAEYFSENIGNDITLETVKIPKARFVMGSPDSEEGYANWEGPQHPVTVSEFWMGKYPVTKEQYWAVMGRIPSHYDLAPVKLGINKPPIFDEISFHSDSRRRPIGVSWNDAVAFCEKLSKLRGRTYRLPSEAEWEYACRAGTTTPFYFGQTITRDLANYNCKFPYGSGPIGAVREGLTDVGGFPPNAFGLYDMHGSICEWCADHWHGDYVGAPSDGSAWLSKNEWAPRVIRGGFLYADAVSCRSAARSEQERDGPQDIPLFMLDFFIGFRVVCDSP